MSLDTYAILAFLLLGMGLGYALGSSRTAKKFAKAAKVESAEAIEKVDTLEAKVDDAVATREQEVTDLSDRIDEHHPEE